MRIIELKYTQTYDIDFKGKCYHFDNGKPRQVPDLLADKLLSTGDFIDVIIDDTDFQVPVDSPAITSKTISVEQSFNKLEVSTDLQKVDKITIGKKYKRRGHTKEKI